MNNKIDLKLKKKFQEYGIGLKTKKKLLHICGINIRLKSTNLKNKVLLIFRKQLKTIVYGSFLKERIKESIQNLISLNTHKGICHRHKHPVRGQRTRRNGKTNRKK
jgi:small subunit ribosomal protein S13